MQYFPRLWHDHQMSKHLLGLIFLASTNNCIREDVKFSVINNLLPFSFFLFIKIFCITAGGCNNYGSRFYYLFFLVFPVYEFCLDHLPWLWHLALQKTFLLGFHWCSRRCFHWHHAKPDSFVVSAAPNFLCQTKGFCVFLLNFQWFFLTD